MYWALGPGLFSCSATHEVSNCHLGSSPHSVGLGNKGIGTAVLLVLWLAVHWLRSCLIQMWDQVSNFCIYRVLQTNLPAGLALSFRELLLPCSMRLGFFSDTIHAIVQVLNLKFSPFWSSTWILQPHCYLIRKSKPCHSMLYPITFLFLYIFPEVIPLSWGLIYLRKFL